MNLKLLRNIIKEEMLREQTPRERKPTSWWLRQEVPETPASSDTPWRALSDDSFPMLTKISTGSSNELIRSGASSESITELQKALVSLGFDIGRSGPNSDGVDGKWGRKTRNALIDFQTEMVADHPETYTTDDIDGVAGEKTAAVLLTSLLDVPPYDSASPEPGPEDDDISLDLDSIQNLGRVLTPEEVPLEQVGDQEPFRMDTSDEPDDWDEDLADDWEHLQNRTKGFISAMPATIASMGHARNVDDAKDQSEDILGSAYRDAWDQSVAVYNFPYLWDLRVRRQNPELQPGDYYKFGQAEDEGRLEMMQQALRDLGASGDTKGVYNNTSSSQYIQVFDDWEALTGGDLDNHRNNRQAAYRLLYDRIHDTYANGHGDGKAIDVPLFRGARDVLDKAEQIAGVNHKTHKEADHWHVTISENEDLKMEKEKRKMTLLERNIQAFLVESDPDTDADDSDELRDIADDLEGSKSYSMSAQLQDVMGPDELEAYGASYDEGGDPTDDDPRNDLADNLNNAVYAAKVSKMDLKNIIDVLAEILVTSQGYDEVAVLDAFSSYVRAADEGAHRWMMRERRLFEASRGRWQKLSGLTE